MGGQGDQFALEVRNFAEKVETISVELKKEAVFYFYRKVVELSPVSTGSYVLSHRIGINQVDESATVNLALPRVFRRIAPKSAGQNSASKAYRMDIGVVKARALLQLSKILKMSPEDVICISNSCPHAKDVEFIGWAKRPPYMVFRKATELTKDWLEAKAGVL